MNDAAESDRTASLMSAMSPSSGLGTMFQLLAMARGESATEPHRDPWEPFLPCLRELYESWPWTTALTDDSGVVIATSPAWREAFGGGAPSPEERCSKVMRRSKSGLMHDIRCFYADGHHFAWLGEARASSAKTAPPVVDAEGEAKRALEDAIACIMNRARENGVALPEPIAAPEEPPSAPPAPKEGVLPTLDAMPNVSVSLEVTAHALSLEETPATVNTAPTTAVSPTWSARMDEGERSLRDFSAALREARELVRSVDERLQTLEASRERATRSLEGSARAMAAKETELQSAQAAQALLEARERTLIRERDELERLRQETESRLDDAMRKVRDIERELAGLDRDRAHWNRRADDLLQAWTESESRERAVTLRAQRAESEWMRARPALDAASMIRDAHVEALSACIAAVMAIAPGTPRSELISELGGLVQRLEAAIPDELRHARVEPRA